MIALAMQLFLGNDEGCKVPYRLMEDAQWYVLDDSGIEQHTTKGVQYGEGDEA
jgi:hypothetical protein